jgi:hypothetical protein
MGVDVPQFIVPIYARWRWDELHPLLHDASRTLAESLSHALTAFDQVVRGAPPDAVLPYGSSGHYYTFAQLESLGHRLIASRFAYERVQRELTLAFANGDKALLPEAWSFTATSAHDLAIKVLQACSQMVMGWEPETPNTLFPQRWDGLRQRLPRPRPDHHALEGPDPRQEPAGGPAPDGGVVRDGQQRRGRRRHHPADHPHPAGRAGGADRTGFCHPDLVRWIRRHHPQLLTQALTILVAYCNAGRPDQFLTPFGSFEGWSGLVRQAVVWAGLPDPCLTRTRLAETSDVTGDSLARLISAWRDYETGGGGLVASELVNRLYAKDLPPRDPASVAMRAALTGSLRQVDHPVMTAAPAPR